MSVSPATLRKTITIRVGFGAPVRTTVDAFSATDPRCTPAVLEELAYLRADDEPLYVPASGISISVVRA